MEIAKALAFKDVNQIAFVVTDLSRALDNFAEKLGIRTWYRSIPSEKESGEVIYNGAKIETDYDFVLGYLGRMQFEVVVVGKIRNIYLDHLEKHGEGLHHISSFVSDFDRKVAAYKKIGVETIQHGKLVSKGGFITRFAYFDNAQNNGLTTEILETRFHGIPMKTSPFTMQLGRITGDLEVVKW